jgi:hypothetical protein
MNMRLRKLKRKIEATREKQQHRQAIGRESEDEKI